MKNVFLLLIALSIQLHANSQSVPNTTTFSLQNVVDVVNPTTDDLVDCFSDANATYFNPTYAGSKNNLLNFRDYGPHNGVSAPTVLTVSSSSLTAVGGNLTGNVTSDGGSTVTSRGIQVSANSDMTSPTNYSTSGNTGSYSVTVSDLTCFNTLYYYRAYASNAIGTSYGSVLSFTTTTPSLTAYNFIGTVNDPAVIANSAATTRLVAIYNINGYNEGYGFTPVRATNINVGTMVYSNSNNCIQWTTERWSVVNLAGSRYAINIGADGKIISSTLITPTIVFYATSSTFTAPAQAISGYVECWGGGGTGGAAVGTGARAAGGAGGSYSRSVISFTASGSYTVTVAGASTAGSASVVNGGNTTFGSSLVVANGGKGGAVNSTSGGAAATTAITTGSIGDVIYVGGNGGIGSASGYAGGGGGGAGSNYVGNNASYQTAGAAANYYGGAGGAGTNISNTRNNGNTYGGAGSGGISTVTTNYAGGNGAAGYMRISY